MPHLDALSPVAGSRRSNSNASGDPATAEVRQTGGRGAREQRQPSPRVPRAELRNEHTFARHLKPETDQGLDDLAEYLQLSPSPHQSRQAPTSLTPQQRLGITPRSVTEMRLGMGAGSGSGSEPVPASVSALEPASVLSWGRRLGCHWDWPKSPDLVSAMRPSSALASVRRRS